MRRLIQQDRPCLCVRVHLCVCVLGEGGLGVEVRGGGAVLAGCCESGAPPSGVAMEGASSPLLSLRLVRKVTPLRRRRCVGHLRRKTGTQQGQRCCRSAIKPTLQQANSPELDASLYRTLSSQGSITESGNTCYFNLTSLNNKCLFFKQQKGDTWTTKRAWQIANKIVFIWGYKTNL